MAVRIYRMVKPTVPARAEREGEISTEPAFEAIFQSYWDRVCRLAARMVGDPHEAEDLALEAFWKLYRRMEYGSLDNPGGWLYRAATRLGYNALRARRRREHYEEAAGRLDTGSVSPGPDSERRWEQRLVRDVLAQMKPRSAEILVLRYSGLSYAEIAGALSVSTGSVGTLLARAEKEFEKRYQKLEGRQE